MVKSFGFALRIAELHVGIFSPRRDRKLLKRRLAEYRRFVRRSFGSDFLAPGDDPESRTHYMDTLARALDDPANFPPVRVRR